jgi:hypothetical protein
MAELILECSEYFDEVKQQADEMGALAELVYGLKQLTMGNYRGNVISRVRLFSDFAPLSFTWTKEFLGDDGKWHYYMNGGLIYSGPGNPSTGGAPSFTVSLDPDAATGVKHMWSVHT